MRSRALASKTHGGHPLSVVAAGLHSWGEARISSIHGEEKQRLIHRKCQCVLWLGVVCNKIQKGQQESGLELGIPFGSEELFPPGLDIDGTLEMLVELH